MKIFSYRKRQLYYGEPSRVLYILGGLFVLSFSRVRLRVCFEYFSDRYL